MKKFIALVALNIVTTLAVASNGYCDTRRTQAEVQRCYSNAVEAQHSIIDRTIQQVYASPKLTHADKLQFEVDTNAWANWVQSACGNNVCMYNEYVKRKNMINNYYHSYAK